MISKPNEFAGWAKAGLPVVTGAEPPGTVSLEKMAVPEEHARLLPLFEGLAGGKRQGALTIVHYAIFAVTTVLIAPLVFDHIALDSAPDQLGLVLDREGGMTAIWVSEVRWSNTDRPSAHIGALSMQLIAPIVEESRRAGKVSALAVTNIVLDALFAACRRLERSFGAQPELDWVDKLIAATGYPGYSPGQPIYAQPDDGPGIEFIVPRICCVLNAQPGPHACPTCPRYPDDATRLRIIHEWLSGLDDDEFRDVTGRARMPRTVEMPFKEVPKP